LFFCRMIHVIVLKAIGKLYTRQILTYSSDKNRYIHDPEVGGPEDRQLGRKEPVL